MTPKIVLWDIETSLLITTTFSLYPERIPHEGILQDWYIISGAWKTLGEKKVHAVSLLDFKQKTKNDDYGVVKALRDMLEGVDIIVGHNQDKFDLRKLNARIIYHGLKPLPKILSVDTLKVAKKEAQFTSNRLDYLAKHLTGKGKIHTTQELWVKALNGDKKAIKEMVEYNKVDVVRLEEVYKKLKPYIKNHPHVGSFTKIREESCRNCGSGNIIKRGARMTATGYKVQACQCTDCGAYSQYPIKKG